MQKKNKKDINEKATVSKIFIYGNSDFNKKNRYAFFGVYSFALLALFFLAAGFITKYTYAFIFAFLFYIAACFGSLHLELVDIKEKLKNKK